MQKLSDEGLPPNQIVQITGHRNVNSLNNYSHLKPEQTRNISSILSNKKRTHTATSDMAQIESSLPQLQPQPLLSKGLTQIESPQPQLQPQPLLPKAPTQTFPTPVPNQVSFPTDHLGLFTGNTISGNINIHFNQSQQLSRNTATWTNTCVSPRQPVGLENVAPVKRFKRIRVIESDSD